MSELLTLREAAARLRVDYETARAWVKSGQLRGVRLGGRRKIQVRTEDIEAFIAASEIAPKAAPIRFGKPRELPRKPRGQKAEISNGIKWYEKYAR